MKGVYFLVFFYYKNVLSNLCFSYCEIHCTTKLSKWFSFIQNATWCKSEGEVWVSFAYRLVINHFSIHWDECGDVGFPLVRNSCRIQIIVQSDSSITGGGRVGSTNVPSIFKEAKRNVIFWNEEMEWHVWNREERKMTDYFQK